MSEDTSLPSEPLRLIHSALTGSHRLEELALDEVVEHPQHYTSHPSGIECIEVTEHMNFCLGNAVKYIWRADLKHDDGGTKDLRKAIWYLERELARRGEASCNVEPMSN